MCIFPVTLAKKEKHFLKTANASKKTTNVSKERLVLTRRGCESEAISHFFD